MSPPPLPSSGRTAGGATAGQPPPLAAVSGAPPPAPVSVASEEAVPSSAPRRGREFLAPFLGAFAAVLLLAGGIGGYFLLRNGVHPLMAKTAKTFSTTNTSQASGPAPSARATRDALATAANWQLGTEAATPLGDYDHADVGWWTRTFHLPRKSVVMGYLQTQGLTVTKLEPLHFQGGNDSETITYSVVAQAPEELVRVDRARWAPSNPDLAQFASILVLNNGLPAGIFWNTRKAAVVAPLGTQLSFAWRLNLDKNADAVTTDRLPYSDLVFTVTQANAYQSESIRLLGDMQARVQAIDDRVQREVQARLAQVQPDPARPGMLSSSWGGDGSGEPTKSAERIGGGAVVGAAGGAAIGDAAGDAGMGAGIGAGVGILGGAIYDYSSKRTDRDRYQHRVANSNSERRSEWRAQLRTLDRQRAQIKADGVAEKQRALADLASRLAASGGRIEKVPAGSIPGPVPSTPPLGSVVR